MLTLHACYCRIRACRATRARERDSSVSACFLIIDPDRGSAYATGNDRPFGRASLDDARCCCRLLRSARGGQRSWSLRRWALISLAAKHSGLITLATPSDCSQVGALGLVSALAARNQGMALALRGRHSA